MGSCEPIVLSEKRGSTVTEGVFSNVLGCADDVKDFREQERKGEKSSI